jgi:hypothetical protein
MPLMQRFSEPYSPTGGLAAEGIINQLGRPDTEPLEVLVREAVQNCWDAKRATAGSIRVEIGRHVLDSDGLGVCRSQLLANPPPGLPLGDELVVGMETLYFADFGTDGLGGPTRADHAGVNRDFVDFVRNIGQPPDKDLGGGSFGYGKAAFYIASRARTILIDTLCVGSDGRPERRFMGCALGDNFDENGRPHTGRHWWGRLVNGIPEPLTGEEADDAAARLRLPERRGEADLGTTIVVVAPGVAPDAGDGTDQTMMSFIADALAWNFWPRMIDTPGATKRTMDFRLIDEGVGVHIPDPRTHQRLRGFVEAMDRLREEPDEDDDLLLDRSVECLRPVQRLGRLVIQKGTVAPADLPDRAVPQGARMTADSLHHVALMRNAELVVKYLPGAVPVTGRFGYSGVFRCAVDVDEAFRRAEPPTHDDWVFRALPSGHQRSFVKIALERIGGVCREAAGYDASMRAAGDGAGVPLGEFADALASLMPSLSGPGARRRAQAATKQTKKRRTPGRTTVREHAEGVWVDGGVGLNSSRDGGSPPEAATTAGNDVGDSDRVRPPRPPQARTRGDPTPAIASDGTAVVRYPFELRGHGSRVRMHALVEVMANDGGQVESEAPMGSTLPCVRAWIDPAGEEHPAPDVEVGPEGVDGRWIVEVAISDELMMRVDLALGIV